MRQSAFLLGVVLFFAGTASAQATLDSTPAVDSSAASSVATAQDTDRPQRTRHNCCAVGQSTAALHRSHPLRNQMRLLPKDPAPQTQAGGVLQRFSAIQLASLRGLHILPFL